MSDIPTEKSKVIAAFKGLINTYELSPAADKRDSLGLDYDDSWLFFSDESQSHFVLHYEKKSYSRLLELVDRLYPGQTDPKLVSDLIDGALEKWVVGSKDVKDQSQLEKAGEDLIAKIELAIQPRLVFLPIEGLEVSDGNSLIIVNCELHKNHKNSSFMQILERIRKLSSGEELHDSNFDERVKSYLTYENTGHPGKVVEQGIVDAEFSLSILRLYLSSFYFHENRRSVVYRMGLYGSLHLNEESQIFHIDPTKSSEEQHFSWHKSVTILQSFKVASRTINFMTENGLGRINQLFQAEPDGDVARRLSIAITWFAKGTSAQSMADSYLMYAIAIEALLSENRTSQSSYAISVASLITCDEDDCLIFPIGGYLSSEFVRQLKEATSVNDKFNLVRERILALFEYRNRIAHGAVLNDEIEAAILLDFETMVRNSILSFLKREWHTLGEFKSWVKDSVRYDFTPRS